MLEYLVSAIVYVIIIYKIYYTRETIIVSVDGNIGSGKSTLVEYLKNNCKKNLTIRRFFIFPKSFKIEFLQEPVDKWLSIKGVNDENILDCFYEDKNRWGYLFQNLAFITRYKILKDAINKNENQIIFVERSTETDKNVFAKMLHSNNDMTTLEYNIYNYWYKMFPISIDKKIYLDVTPNICSKRIKKRGRESEKGIDILYLNKLKEFHDNWLLTLPKNCVKIVNGNINYSKQHMNNTMHDIIAFIKS